MKKQKELLLHIGYHKTGTSFLQKKIFTDQKLGFCSPADRFELRNAFIRTSPFDFNPDAVRSKFMPGVQAALDQGLVPVLSHEQFSGQPQGGGYGVRIRDREASRKEVADRLKICFPNAIILIVIREQRDMIRSIYKYLTCGWHGKLSATIDEFLDVSPLEDGYSPLFHFSYLYYHQVIQYYQSLFGMESVLILPFEWLRDKPELYINQLLSFVTLKQIQTVDNQILNKGFSAATAQFRRVMNRLVVSPNKPGKLNRAERVLKKATDTVNGLIPAPIHNYAESKLIEKIEQLTVGKFTESNQITMKLTKLNLAGLNYETDGY